MPLYEGQLVCRVQLAHILPKSGSPDDRRLVPVARTPHPLRSVVLLFVLGACLAPADGSSADGSAARIAIVSGNHQGALLGQPLPEPLIVGLFNGGGRPLTRGRIAWTVSQGHGTLSADTTTASDSGRSQVAYTVGSVPGTDSVRATLVGGDANENVTFGVVAGENRSPWPNEPAGFRTLSDWPYNQMVTKVDGGLSGGAEVWNQSPGRGSGAIVRDSSAPLSPPNVAQLTYPPGMPSGLAPWNLYLLPQPAGREFYTAFWWKANAGWQGDPSGINKIIFWQDAAPGSANLIVMMNNQRQPDYFLTVTLEFNQASNGQLVNSAGGGAVWHVFGNVRGGNYVITPGTWYRIELYFKGSTTPTSQDGVVRWWATKQGDAAPTPIGDYTNVNFDSPNFIQFSFAPTWGGNSGVYKTQTDYYRIDHVHLSRP
jgi:hypothetical protein